MCIDARDVFISIYIYSSPFFAAGNKRESGRGGKGVFSMNITRTDSLTHTHTHTHTHRERGVAQRDWFQKELFMTRLAKGTRRRKRRRYELAARVINVIKSIWRATVVSYGGGAIPAVAYIILLSNANDPKTTLHAHLATRRKKTSVINPSRTPCLLFHQLSIVCVCVLLVERWKEKKKEVQRGLEFPFCF